MDRNFKIRVACGFLLLFIAAISLPFFDSIGFKIFFIAFACVSALELFSFFKKKNSVLSIFLVILELILLVLGSVFVFQNDFLHITLLIFGVCGYDVFAYLFGKMFGGKIFKKSRPFPHISKNKTWEGTFFGLLSSCLLVWILLGITNSQDYIFFACAPLALIGDLAESALKRSFGIKDSNEIVIKNKIFAKIELLVGGDEGHGGYLDRIDSIVFTATILLLLTNLF